MSGPVCLKARIGTLELDPAVTVCSGTVGFGLEYFPYQDFKGAGAVILKSVTAEPREGNPPPRLAETPAGIINSVGLQNPGVETLCREILPRVREEISCPIIVNIAGFSLEEYAHLAQVLDSTPGVSALEINISCPNVREGGLIFGTCRESAVAVVERVRANTALPLITKLSAAVGDLVGIARAVAEAGSDGLSLINTLPAMAIDWRTGRPALGNAVGGLSGPAIKPVALRAVYEVSQKVDLPIIGMGGIMTATDALEFIMAGASAVAVGTGTLVDPRCLDQVADGLKAYLEEKGWSSLDQLRGVAWNGGRG